MKNWRKRNGGNIKRSDQGSINESGVKRNIISKYQQISKTTWQHQRRQAGGIGEESQLAQRHGGGASRISGV